MTQYVVETYSRGPFRNYEAFELKEARRKAAWLSKRSEDLVSYVVAVEDGEYVGHMVYGLGRLLRTEGRGF